MSEIVEVVIRIPKRTYDRVSERGIIAYGDDAYYIGHAIASGTVLPKGHGELVDRDRLINRCLFMSNDDTAIEGMEYITKGMIKTAPTVIEADEDGE